MRCVVRCNISYLEEWLKEQGLGASSAMDTLKPLSQAAWLLQVNKSTDEDAKDIADNCTELNPVQVPWRDAVVLFAAPHRTKPTSCSHRVFWVSVCRSSRS